MKHQANGYCFVFFLLTLAGLLSATFNGYDFQEKTTDNVVKIGDLSCALMLTIKFSNAENLKKQSIAWISLSKGNFGDSHLFETLSLFHLWIPKTSHIMGKMAHSLSHNR